MKHALDELHWLYIGFAAIVLLLAMGASGCQHPAPPSPITPGGATCADVCSRYRQLGCAAGQPTAHGVSCEEVCSNAQGLLHQNLACRAAAASCDAADHCED